MDTQLPFFGMYRRTVKHRLFELLFRNEKRPFYLREMAELLRCDPTNLSRDLKRLEHEGMVISEFRGNQKYFRLNKRYVFYDDINSMLTKQGGSPLHQAQSLHQLVYVIAGPNGAGKTTFAKTFLPKYGGCDTFINADLIAGGIAPLKPDQAALKAGRLLLDEIRQAADKRINFGFETTLSGKSYVHLLRQLKKSGYGICLFFLWIPNVEISLKRIAGRVKRGGHHIPEKVARRRFYRGIQNLFNLYKPLLDNWCLMDNSGIKPEMVAYECDGEKAVCNPIQYEQILKEAGLR